MSRLKGEPQAWWNLKPCGTRAAYYRHKRNGEEPCQADREACARDQRRRDAERTAAGWTRGTVIPGRPRRWVPPPGAAT